MAPYCSALLRHRESHEEAIYAIAFNQIDASLADVFATVGQTVSLFIALPKRRKSMMS